ncbi:MAG: anhydro-N-acetylmuramic acid kinase [Candidatus Thiodiazotropha sp. (ex Monitilora ramsayi)]|nr:anhydro-N-acetylmuramic acid kinase [Candidatus Thiodiazotropha sp. (ex Monitilora ramsayi)]
MPNESLFIGLISGTSLDGIDAVLVDASDAVPQLIASRHTPYTPALLDNLRTLTQPGDNEIDRLGELDRQVALAFVESVNGLLTETGISASDITAIGSHGQTVRHRPTAVHPFTLQIGDPNTLAEMTGITTVGDFRRRDMAAGGEGAPLVPAFHQAVLQSPVRSRVVLNLGGIANITCLPKAGEGEVSGFDTGPANTLLDSWIDKHQCVSYDHAGAWAKEGMVIESLLAKLLRDPYFELPSPKSTGTEYFNLSWLEAQLGEESYSPVDIQRTLTELTAASVAMAIDEAQFSHTELLVCGGGVHNLHLMDRLQNRLPNTTVRSSAEEGLDPDWVEAMAFAWLAQRTLSGLTGNLPSVTGARRAVKLGAIYPG